MVTLGLAPKKPSVNQDDRGGKPAAIQNGTSEEAKRLAAAALSAVRDATSAAAAAAAAGRGKIEVSMTIKSLFFLLLFIPFYH